MPWQNCNFTCEIIHGFHSRDQQPYFSKKTKESVCLIIENNPGVLGRDTNMAAVSALFVNTNMAVVTSCETRDKLTLKFRAKLVCVIKWRKPFDCLLMSWVTNYTHNRKSLEYFIQLLGKNHLQVFLKAIFVTPLLKNPHPVSCAISRI